MLQDGHKITRALDAIERVGTQGSRRSNERSLGGKRDDHDHGAITLSSL
jgi:hypothetical protein